MDIGQLILDGLLKKKMSQKELAYKLGVKPPTFNKWISGQNGTPASKLVEIIKMLDLVEEFFPGYRKIDPNEEEKDIEIKKELKLLKEQMLQNVKDLQELKAQRV